MEDKVMSLALYLVLTPLIACSFSQVLKTIFLKLFYFIVKISSKERIY